MTELDNYLTLRKQADEIKEQLAYAQQLLMDKMHRDNLLSVKHKLGNVSLAKRVTKRVNELEFNQWLKDQPDMERDMFYKEVFDDKKAVALADNLLKNDGEIVPYITSVEETEYLSIRKVSTND